MMAFVIALLIGPQPGLAQSANTGQSVVENAAGKLPVSATARQLAQSPAAPLSVNTTLSAELTELLRSHPRLQGARDQLNAAREEERQAFSGFLPTVTVTGDSGREVVDSPGTRSSFGEATQEYRQKATLSLTQNLFRGFATTGDHRRAIAQGQVASANLDSVQQSVLFEGISNYYTVLRQRTLVGLAIENEKILKEQLRLEDERVTRGSGIAVDVLLAKTRLQLAIEQQVQFSGALEAAIARYTQVFGRAPAVRSMRRPVDLKALLPSDLDEAIKEAADHNPSLLATDRQVLVARHNTVSARSGYFPTVDMVLQGNWEKDVDGVIGVRRDWSALLRVSWDIFSGFLTESTASAAVFEKAVAHNNHRDNVRKVTENLRISWQQFNTAKKRVRLLDNAVAIAEEVFIARQRLRDAGRETAINVLDAQREVFAARINLVAAQFDAEIAAFAVMSATGMLTTNNLRL